MIRFYDRPRPILRIGQRVRVHCKNDRGQEWKMEGRVAGNTHDYLFLDLPDDAGVYAWDCIEKVETEYEPPSKRGERWNVRAVVTDDKVIVNNKVTIVREFVGPDAVEEAAMFIDTLPDVRSGRYGIDACIPAEDAHCEGCDCPKG